MEKLSVKSNSGQALLVILLIMAVILTIGLATISRSVTDIKISEQTEDSARAFSAAEAGIESYLSTGSTVTTGLSGVNVQLAQGSLFGVDDKSFLYPEKISQNEIATIWLSTYDKKLGTYTTKTFTSPLSVAWGNSGTPSDNSATPALEVSFYYRDASGINKAAKYLLDTASIATRNMDNGFCKAGMAMGTGACTGVISLSTSGTGSLYGSQTLQFSASLDISPLNLNGLLFARLRLLYSGSSHYVGLAGNTSLPSQGDKIAATGTSNQATRKVEVYRLNPAPPDIFDFALYSGGSLVK